MKLTKYEHACIVLEEQGAKLVIDPGGFTPEFGDPNNIAAVIVTHAHPDHFSTEHLEAIFAANPGVPLFTVNEVAEQLKRENVHAVSPGQAETVGPFRLRFSGELHELIHASLPRPHNTAVLVNDVFFNPGDSYTLPDTPVKILAVPGNAPWMTVGDSMDYIAKVKPEQCFPTHNGLLSENGHKVYNFALSHAAETAGTKFVFLRAGESIEL